MRAIVFVSLCLISVAAAYTYTSDYHPDAQFTAFTQFITRFNKKYTNIAEFADRFTKFQASLQRIAQGNADGRNVFGVTQFSDLSPEEFRASYLGFKPELTPNAPTMKSRRIREVGAVPKVADVDWRNNGTVTPVKDQGQCGSCWAFSATEAIESAWLMAGNSQQILAPQQIVSCDTTDSGCDGGWPTSAYQYVQSAGGIETDAAYPYTSGDNGDSGTCSFDQTQVAVQISGFTYATPSCEDDCDNQDEITLANNLATGGPVSVCVDAETWQDYSGGVLTDCDHAYTDLDHCVQAVGYHIDSNPTNSYWIVRNSWAASWGESGYIRLSFGANTCGLADLATQVTI